MTSHRSDRGFSMFLVIMAMFITAMFVAAAFAAANGDLPLSGQPKERKVAYAAAEAGLSFYETHLNADPDYWTNCDDVPAPNGTEQNPVNLAGATPLRWRNVTGSQAQYTIEILPSAGNAKCIKGVQSTVLDQSTGTFRIRVTGRATTTSKIHRSIIATFKRKGFLDYLWFTDVEDKDPQAMSTQTERTNATTYCESGTPPTPLYRWQRPSTGGPSNACTEIQWITGDVVDGPLHSNDSLLICGAPQFGGTGGSDAVEVVPTNQPRVTAAGCTDSTDMEGQWKTGVGKLVPPADDQPLKAIAQSDGDYFSGKTIIRLETDGSMTVTTGGQPPANMQMPDNGVIYVDSNPKAVCSVIFPSSVTYGETDDGCGNVYVSGTYSSNLTIASANDIIIAPTAGGKLSWGSTDEALVKDQSKDVVLGLIANRFVRVGHAVSRSNGCSNVASGYSSLDLTVSAAILALQHSWMVDNYDCGMAGHLTVNGAIAQEWRGPVGTGGHASGYLKDYHYDSRLRYRSPPYFLSPVAAQWSPIRENEQVPAT